MYNCTATYFLQKEIYTQLVYFLFSVTYWARKRRDFQGPNLTNIELAQLLGKVSGITWNKMMPTPDEPQLQVSKKRPGPHFKKNCPPFKSSGKIILCHSTLFCFFSWINTIFPSNYTSWKLGYRHISPFLFSSAELNWVSISSSIALSPCFNKLSILSKKVLGSNPPSQLWYVQESKVREKYIVNEFVFLYSYQIDTVKNYEYCHSLWPQIIIFSSFTVNVFCSWILVLPKVILVSHLYPSQGSTLFLFAVLLCPIPFLRFMKG